MSQTNQTPGEITDSLTGHEEMWIAGQFGRSIGELAQGYLEHNDIGPYYRALIFILKRREGVNEDEAREAALNLMLGDVLSYFPRPEIDDEVPAVEESGKDGAQSEPPPEISLVSVP